MPAPKGHQFSVGNKDGKPRKYTRVMIEKEAEEFLHWLNMPDSIFFKSFAIQRGYHPNRLAEFAKMNEKFSGAYELAKAWQEVKLVEGGLTNQFNANFTKFALSNISGWSDRQHLSADVINPLAILLDRIDGKTKDPCRGAHESSH